MEFIKKHKFTFVAIACFLVLIVVLAQVKSVFFPNEGKANYGNRLDGIENVKISSDKEDQIAESIKNVGNSKEVKVDLKGRLINIIVTVNDDVSADGSKVLADKIGDSLSEDQKKYFDAQIFIKKTNDDKSFPIIGYRHHTKDSYSWTKNR